MAAGLPIASSDKGPMPEVLAEAGVYFDPEEATSIASALRKLVLNASLRERLAELAWRKALAYSWERCARLHLSLRWLEAAPMHSPRRPTIYNLLAQHVCR